MIRQMVGPVTDSDVFVRASRLTEQGKDFLRGVGTKVKGRVPDPEKILESAFRFWLDFPDYLQSGRTLRARASLGYYVGDISGDESVDGKTHRRSDAVIEAKNFVDFLDPDAVERALSLAPEGMLVERGTFYEGPRGRVHLSQAYDPY